MGLVMDLADRVLVLDFGAPVTVGVPAEIQRNPDVIKAYLGEEHTASGVVADEVVSASGGEAA